MRHTGVQTRTGVVVPGLNSIKSTVSLTKEAKQRLKWIDFYESHEHNARLTCRHYGIHHKTFYRYYNRFKVQGLAGLENKSHRPNQLRTPTTPQPVINAVKTLRKANPEYSKYKLEVILKREYDYQVSSSTIGRIIKKYNLYFAPPVKQKGHPGRKQSIVRIRKPQPALDLTEVNRVTTTRFFI